jgi:hypothetical protein
MTSPLLSTPSSSQPLAIRPVEAVGRLLQREFSALRGLTRPCDECFDLAQRHGPEPIGFIPSTPISFFASTGKTFHWKLS